MLLSYDGPIAVMTNNRPEKHNAASDEMDARLFEILDELRTNKDVRAVIWNANGKSWSSGRDVGQIGVRTEDIDNLSFIERGQGGFMRIFDLDAPVICALKGWVIGGSFERSLVADIRICTPTTRFMLPEVKHGVITDTGGMARLFQMCGHGVAMDLINRIRQFGLGSLLASKPVDRAHGSDRGRRGAPFDPRGGDHADAHLRIAGLRGDEGGAGRGSQADLPAPLDCR